MNAAKKNKLHRINFFYDNLENLSHRILFYTLIYDRRIKVIATFSSLESLLSSFFLNCDSHNVSVLSMNLRNGSNFRGLLLNHHSSLIIFIYGKMWRGEENLKRLLMVSVTSTLYELKRSAYVSYFNKLNSTDQTALVSLFPAFESIEEILIIVSVFL